MLGMGSSLIGSTLLYAAPEILLASMAMLILISDRYFSKISESSSYWLSQLTLILAFASSFQLLGLPTEIIFSHSFILDDKGTALKLILYLYAFCVFAYSKPYLLERKMAKGEYFSLSLFSILGMSVLISARSFISLYLGLELLALPLYALIAFNREHKKAPEAAMKYFVMGALASGMLLYGISMLYGITGTLELSEVWRTLSQAQGTPSWPILIGLVFVIVGLAFKLGVVPFHFWVPDVYQGSMNSVTLFIATLPELAAFGMAVRLLDHPFLQLDLAWQSLLVIMAVLSLVLGNLLAIVQSNFKRMLAYSSIAHMGFVLLGLIAGYKTGYSAACAYIFIYALTVLAAFGIIVTLSKQGFELEHIKDLQGLSQSRPWLAFLMLLVMLSLGGIPPAIGFSAKFMVLDALLRSGSYVWLATLALMMSVVAAFYYLRVIKVMFFDSAPALQPAEALALRPLSRSSAMPSLGLVLLSLNGLAMLLLGLYPAPIILWCMQIFRI